MLVSIFIWFRTQYFEGIVFFIESDTDLKKVISKSGLEKFVYSLPRGLDTLINENGNNISGGEKQRIGIAIALLRKTPIIVYDEPTSNLDNVVAQEIEQKLLDNDQGCIMNTHKVTCPLRL